MSTPPVVVICQGRVDVPAARSLRRELLAGLSQWPGISVAVMPHLYYLAADGAGMELLRSVEGDLIVLAELEPRAAFWVLDANGVKGRVGGDDDAETQRKIWCFDLRAHNDAAGHLREIERLIAKVGNSTSSAKASTASAAQRQSEQRRLQQIDEPARPRWYPVVDRLRCGNCLECLNFCLFGVYGVDAEGRLAVQQPDACRDGCPACARVCPSGAIMFPHHALPAIAGGKGPMLGGAELVGTDLVQLGGDAPSLGPAAAERRRALEQAAGKQEDLDRLVDELDRLDL